MDFNKNYYSILGVSQDASDDDIKKSYRKLAKEHHPDANNNKDDSRFKEINEAYSVIGDNKERQKYDVHSPHGKNFQPVYGDMFANIFGSGGGFNPFKPFDSFFRDIFNRKEEFVENLDIKVSVKITLKDVYNDNNIAIKYTRDVKCVTCNFTGFDPESESFECDTCDGKGNDGFTTCKYCGGTGKIHTGACKKCNGEKVVSRNEELAFSNSYFIEESFMKYIRDKGHQSKYYPNRVGSLQVQADYVHDNRYIRDGYNLIYPLNLHFQSAIDGIEYEYEHLDDKKYSLKIPPRTKDGDILRIGGKGLLIDGKKRGDLLIKINIIIDYDRIL